MPSYKQLFLRVEAKAHHQEAANSSEADSEGVRVGSKAHAQASHRASACLAIERLVCHQGLEHTPLETDMDHGKEPSLLCMPEEMLQDIANRLPTR